MDLVVTVKTNAGVNRIIKNDESHWRVEVNCPPVDGKANKKVIEEVASELRVAKSRVMIKRGEKSKVKVLEIL